MSGSISESKEIMVFVGDEEGIPQPDTFRCCPLGVQFYSPRELPCGSILQFALKAPEGSSFSGSVDCTGIVIHSQYSKTRGMHRIWVLFEDLPEPLSSQLKCLGRNRDFLCPHCENF